MSEYHNGNYISQKLHVITEVARTLAINLELPELLQAVLEKITSVLEQAEFGVILIWDPSTQLIRPQAASGPALSDRDAVLAISLTEEESITGSVFATGKARVLTTPEEIAIEMSNLHPAKRTAMNKGYGLYGLPR